MADDLLQRFVDAQDEGDTYARAVAELRAGRKASHWMWFVFPQLRGLGQSAMARRYALDSLEEARGYLQHPVLGPRLRECTQLMLALPVADATAVLGMPDDMKFRSSMTLFREAAPEEPLFDAALHRYFGGAADARTLALLRG